MANGVVVAWSRAQAEAQDCIASQHGARRVCFLCGVRPGRAGTAAILLLPHATGVLQAPVVAPFSQIHYVGGYLRPLL
jgi:hypothetical protein